MKAVSDDELQQTISNAKNGNEFDIYYAIVGLIERNDMAAAEALALELHEFGFAEGCGVLAENAFDIEGAFPDQERCLAYALRHANSNRRNFSMSAIIAGKIYEQRGQLEQAVDLYKRATTEEEAENSAAWLRMACICMRPGQWQDALEAARFLAGYVSAEGEAPDDVPDAPVEYDGAWVSVEYLEQLFEMTSPDRRADLTLILFEGGLLVPRSHLGRDNSFEAYNRGPALNPFRPGAFHRILKG